MTRHLRATLSGTPAARPQQPTQFPRPRPERVRPEDIDLGGSDRRRTPRLRREEVTLLAGLSAAHSVPPEPDRDHRPSENLLKTPAHALQLNDDNTDHPRYV